MEDTLEGLILQCIVYRKYSVTGIDHVQKATACSYAAIVSQKKGKEISLVVKTVICILTTLTGHSCTSLHFDKHAYMQSQGHITYAQHDHQLYTADDQTFEHKVTDCVLMLDSADIHTHLISKNYFC